MQLYIYIYIFGVYINIFICSNKTLLELVVLFDIRNQSRFIGYRTRKLTGVVGCCHLALPYGSLLQQSAGVDTLQRFRSDARLCVLKSILNEVLKISRGVDKGI